MFWNTKKNESINRFVVNAIVENNCDIVILAEYISDIDGLCNELSVHNKDFRPFTILCDRISIAASLDYKQEMIFEKDYFSIQNITNFGKEFLVMALHFPSRLYSGEDEHRALAIEALTEVKAATKIVEHNNVIVVGDFNANPFDKICINADCFHAVPSREVSKRKKRKVNGVEYEMYYNPMWNLFGDNNTPSGTYYYSGGKISNYFWNIYDQVIFSSEMAYAFEIHSLKIVSAIEGMSLINSSGIPDSQRISDHLPVFFQFREEDL